MGRRYNRDSNLDIDIGSNADDYEQFITRATQFNDVFIPCSVVSSQILFPSLSLGLFHHHKAYHYT